MDTNVFAPQTATREELLEKLVSIGETLLTGQRRERDN